MQLRQMGLRPEPLATSWGEAFEKVNEWKRRRRRLIDQAKAILDKARAERRRDLTDEERLQFDNLRAEIAGLNQKIAAASEKLGLPWPEPAQPPVLW